MSKKTVDVKILSSQVRYDGFNRLVEYDLQAPSLHEGREYAAPLNREVIHCQDSVVVLIYCTAADSFLFCEQFRTGPYFNTGDDPCFILEAPAGMVDPGYTPQETAFKEVREETGVELNDLEFICQAYASSGRLTEKTYFYFAEIAALPQTGMFGSPDEDEEIRTHLVGRSAVYKMLEDFKFLHAQTILALNWFRANRDPECGACHDRPDNRQRP